MVSPSWQSRLPWVEGPVVAREGRLTIYILALPVGLHSVQCALGLYLSVNLEGKEVDLSLNRLPSPGAFGCMLPL